MPCRTDPDPEYEYRQISDALNRREAMLCAVLRALRDRVEPFEAVNDNPLEFVLSRIDWDEAGVTEVAFRDWWYSHVVADQKRIAREKSKKMMAEAIQKIREVLTPEELEQLNITFKPKTE